MNKRLHCPKCGYVCEVPSDAADDRSMICSDCRFHYHVADGAIWEMTVLRAVGHVSKLVQEIAEEGIGTATRQLRLTRLKAAVIKGLLEVGWLGSPVKAPVTQLSQANDAVEKVLGARRN